MYFKQDFRQDSRSKKQFMKDLKVGHEKEKRAIELYSKFLTKMGIEHVISENGSDGKGTYIEDVRKVSKKADFKLNGTPLEVKTCKTITQTIYFKKGQIDSYIKQGASLLFVMGMDKNLPVFTLLTPDDLRLIKKHAPVIKPNKKINGGKLSYVFDYQSFQFLYFDGGKFI